MIMDNIKRSLENIFTFLCKPFTEYIRFFVTAFLMSVIVDFIGFTQFESFYKAIFIALHHYVICYVLTLIMCILPNILIKWYKYFVYLLLSINFLIDIVCVYSFHFTFDQEIPAILIGTNSNETLEFIETFIPVELILIILFSFIFFCLLNRILYRVKSKENSILNVLLLSLVLLSFFIFPFVSIKNFGNVSVTKISTFLKATAPPDLSDYYVNPKLVNRINNKPKNVVMIIGESFSKRHSSLYGYDKNTNPYLQQLVQDSLLYVFANITSPATTTVPVFKSIMSTYKPEYGDTIKWYECLSIQEVLKKSGYKTYWISNQSQAGLYDNIIAKYASLCDITSFSGNRFKGFRKTDLDEIVLDSIRKYDLKHDSNELNFTFIHLMGSHHDFKKRYPSSFNKFTVDDYIDKLDSQKQALSEYDNSVLYNDSIINEIIKIYEDEESIIIYFSDHSIDLYDSRDDYVGHAMPNNEKSIKAGTEIPFIVYISHKFQTNFPEDCERIRNAVNKKFRTDNMIYTIMDIIGTDFKNCSDVKKYSLF